MSNRNDDRSRRIQASMANDPFFDDASDVLDEHELLDEGEFIDDDDGGFDDEATAVFRADLHGSHPDPWSSEGSLGHDAGDYTDEATSVLMEPEPEPAPAPYVPPQGNQPRPARPSGAHGRVPSYSAPRAAAPQAHAPRAQAAPARAAHGYPSGGQGAVHHGTPGVAEVAARRDDEMAEEATVVTDIHTFQQQQQQQAAGYPPNASGNWAAGAAAGGAAWQQAQAGARGAPSGGWQAQQQVRPNTGQAPAMIAVPRAQPEKRGMGGLQIALLALVVLAFLGVAGLGVRFLLMDRTPDVVQGSVAFMTTPPGAAIEIDGETWAEVTPAVVGGLDVGRAYAITLTLEGHEPIRDTITLEDDGALQKSWTLDALTGTITVASQPPGAMITIDGDESGEAPATVDDLDMSRSYTVMASLDGYEPVTRTIRWDAEGPREQNIAITLTPVIDGELEEVEAPEDEDEEPAVAATTNRSATSAQTAPSRPSTTRPSTTRPSASAPTGSRPSGSRPSAGAPTGSRPSAGAPTGSRPSAGAPTGSRPSAGAPTGSRPSASAPSGSRPSGARPSGDRPSGSRPSAGPPSGSRPSGSRPSGDRPSASAPPAAPTPAPTAGGDGYVSVQAVPFGQVWINNRMVASETPLMNHALPAGVHQVKVYFTPIRQFSEERTVRVEPGSSRTLTFHAPR